MECRYLKIRGCIGQFVIYLKWFWSLIPEMNAPRKAMEWLICFSIVNLMLGCPLFKKSKKFNESYFLSKAARMSWTYLK